MMAALVQAIPTTSTSTITMFQGRSSADPYQNSAPGQQHSRGMQTPRNIYNTAVGGMSAGSYRGQQSSAPVAPYAFSSTPSLQNGQNPLRQHPTSGQHPRMETRSMSVPTLTGLQLSQNVPQNRPRPAAMNNAPTPLNPTHPNALIPTSANTFKDHSSVNYPASRPLSAIDLNSSPSYATVAKSSPDRYRRNPQRAQSASGLSGTPVPGGSAVPSGSGMATVGHLYNHPSHSSSSPALSSHSSYRGTVMQVPIQRELDPATHPRLASKDDMNLQRQSSSELAKRYRRRSISSLEVKEFGSGDSASALSQPKTYAAMLAGPVPTDRKENRSPSTLERPTSAHGRNPSAESSVSGPSTTGSVCSDNPNLVNFIILTSWQAKRSVEIRTAATAQQATPAKVVHVPARGSSDANKRLTNPSPLGNAISGGQDAAPKEKAVLQEKPIMAPASTAAIPESPAAQQLAALNKKEGKKEGKSSRLRRAFSFGSAAELRKASAENSVIASAERAKLKKPQPETEEDAQQAAIAQQQEASGLGSGIYSGQGNFFTGSTDNLSISSTASSASVMIRKMGKGMKRGSRSLVGLFRPKSIIGAPTTDNTAPEPSVAQVSMVTVEAEREKVNVNINPHDQPGGGTGFPKLERNSLETGSVAHDLAPAFADSEGPRGRQSIVGGERERAEVLAAVKKGILKRECCRRPILNYADNL